MGEPSLRCSVVVPTWNRADRIGTAIEPLREAVERGEIEVVVVDDGSTDATPSVLATYPWIRSIRRPNGGAAAARNTGWRNSRADTVVFLDDDCVPQPGWPSDFLSAFDDPDVGGAGGTVRAVGHSWIDVFVAVERLVDHGRDIPGSGVDYLVTANAAYRRRLLEQVDGFDEGFAGAAGEDVDLAWRVRATGARLVRCDATVLHHHRAGVADVVRTYRAHGRARAALDQRHPDRPVAAAAASALTPRTWRTHFHAYRTAGLGRTAAVGATVLRGAGLAAYAVGVVTARR